MKFDELKLNSKILAGVAAAGFEECTAVQSQAIPHVIDGSDVMVQSQTGTGKTAAFLLPTFQLLKFNPDFAGAMALIVAPTRELAVQIKEESEMLGEDLGIRTEVFHGGVGYGPQQKALADGLDIIVGTPGRMLDLTQSGHMQLSDVRMVVIDEADRLFDMGFYPDIRRLFRRLRPREERINMLFSATLSTKARNIAWEHMNDPVEIEIEPEHVTVDKVTQTLYHVASEDKMSVLLGVMKQRAPRTAIVFTNTKRAAEEVAKRLEINGYPTEFIIGDLPQKKRQKIIQRIKAGDAEFLVATDVAARGLHINDLDMVVNYDLPEDPEAYVHRIGRTARAGESGAAVSLACQRYVFGLESIESLIRQKIPVEPVSEELYAEDASSGMRIRTGDAARDRDGRDRDRGRRGGRQDRGPRSDRGSRTERSARPERSTRPDRAPRTDRAARPQAGGESGRGGARKPARRSAERTPTGGAPKSSDSLEARLEYYRQKYGEDFQPTDEMLKNMQGGGGKRRPQGSKKPRDAARDQAPRSEKPAKAPSGQDKPEKGGKKGLFGALRSLFGGDE